MITAGHSLKQPIFLGMQKIADENHVIVIQIYGTAEHGKVEGLTKTEVHRGSSRRVLQWCKRCCWIFERKILTKFRAEICGQWDKERRG